LNPARRLTLILSCAGMVLASSVASQASSQLTMPQWEQVFSPGGALADNVEQAEISGPNVARDSIEARDFIDLHGALGAEFIQETLSQGLATDMSALLPSTELGGQAIFRGPVSPQHDLGNAYLFVSGGQYFAAVERLSSVQPSFIDFELNQSPVLLTQSQPWFVTGKRTDGDVRVRLSLAQEIVKEAEVFVWSDDQWQFISPIHGVNAAGCGSVTGVAVCVGSPPIVHPERGMESWDHNFQLVFNPPADQFFEVGFDIPALLGMHLEFNALQIRTPEDIAFSTFGSRKLAGE